MKRHFNAHLLLWSMVYLQISDPLFVQRTEFTFSTVDGIPCPQSSLAAVPLVTAETEAPHHAVSGNVADAVDTAPAVDLEIAKLERKKVAKAVWSWTPRAYYKRKRRQQRAIASMIGYPIESPDAKQRLKEAIKPAAKWPFYLEWATPRALAFGAATAAGYGLHRSFRGQPAKTPPATARITEPTDDLVLNPEVPADFTFLRGDQTLPMTPSGMRTFGGYTIPYLEQPPFVLTLPNVVSAPETEAEAPLETASEPACVFKSDADAMFEKEAGPKAESALAPEPENRSEAKSSDFRERSDAESESEERSAFEAGSEAEPDTASECASELEPRPESKVETMKAHPSVVKGTAKRSCRGDVADRLAKTRRDDSDGDDSEDDDDFDARYQRKRWFFGDPRHYPTQVSCDDPAFRYNGGTSDVPSDGVSSEWETDAADEHHGCAEHREDDQKPGREHIRDMAPDYRLKDVPWLDLNGAPEPPKPAVSPRSMFTFGQQSLVQTPDAIADRANPMESAVATAEAPMGFADRSSRRSTPPPPPLHMLPKTRSATPHPPSTPVVVIDGNLRSKSGTDTPQSVSQPQTPSRGNTKRDSSDMYIFGPPDGTPYSSPRPKNARLFETGLHHALGQRLYQLSQSPRSMVPAGGFHRPLFPSPLFSPFQASFNYAFAA